MERIKYLEFAGKSADYIWSKYEELYERERKGVLERKRLDNTMSYLSFVSQVDAARYKVYGDKKYLTRAKKEILDIYRFYEEITAYAKENDIEIEQPFPMLGWMFEVASLVKAYELIKEDAGFTPDEIRKIERIVEESVNPIFTFPEHGAENRCALKAVNMIYAAKAFPDNPMAKKWAKLAKRMIADSVNHWSIEDASTYMCLWVHVLLSFNEASPIINPKEDPFILYNAKYLAAMQLPQGVFADYGDGRWGSDWGVMIAVIERCASLFSSGELKYAAQKCFEYMTKLDDGTGYLTWKTIPILADCYFWADDSIVPVQPAVKSQEVLDDVIGKKIVFRSGWRDEDTFLMLNYKDEGCDGVLARDNLRQSLAVRAEKMHHGHADENSITMLSMNGCILLHDGGYRQDLESGAYRADYYHNKLLVRSGSQKVNQGFYDYARDAGSYCPVYTERLYFYTYDRIESSRTKIVDDYHCVTSERCVHYLKEENIFVVVDIVKPHRYGEYSFGCAYHNRHIEKIGETRCRAWSEFIGSDEYMREIPNGTSTKLIIDFALAELPVEVLPIKRCYTDETVVCQYFTGMADEYSDLVFVSLLVPEIDGKCADYSVNVQKGAKGCLTDINVSGKKYRLFDRYRLESARADLNKRPSYTFEAGNSKLDGVETDGLFTAVIDENESIYYAFVNATRVDYQGKTLFSVEPIDHYQLSFINEPGISSWSSWDDTIQK